MISRIAVRLRWLRRNASRTHWAARLLGIRIFGPPAIDAQELTDKGSVNQHAVLANRAPIVERLYAAACDDAIIEVQ